MSENSDFDRNMIPKWRSYKDTVRKGELGSANLKRVEDKRTKEELNLQAAEKYENWAIDKTKWTALELRAAAILINHEDWIREAELHLDEEDERRNEKEVRVYTPQIELQSRFPQMIRRLRNDLRMYCEDPIRWMDLALMYTNLGIFDSAARAASVAISGGRNNRFILRSCSRFWVHLGEPDRAHDILAKAISKDLDPWLLSAEISAAEAAERETRHLRRARRLMADDSLAPRHTSELALELAKVQMRQGWIGRKGRRETKNLIEKGLRVPTESTFAQAAWYSRRGIRVPEISRFPGIDNAYEAIAWIRYGEGEWNASISACKSWQQEEPYSSRPAVLGSFLSAIATDDYKTSEGFARTGLVSNKDDVLLWNNLTVSLANQGKVEEAEDCLRRLRQLSRGKRSDGIRPAWLATSGLVAFRKGQIERGRALYFDAATMVRPHKNLFDENFQALVLAILHHSIEERNVDPALSERLKTEAQDLITEKKKNRQLPWINLAEGLLERRLGRNRGVTRS